MLQPNQPAALVVGEGLPFIGSTPLPATTHYGHGTTQGDHEFRTICLLQRILGAPEKAQHLPPRPHFAARREVLVSRGQQTADGDRVLAVPATVVRCDEAGNLVCGGATLPLCNPRGHQDEPGECDTK